MYWLPYHYALLFIAEEKKDCYVEVVYLGKPTDPDNYFFRMVNTIDDVKAKIQHEKGFAIHQQKIVFNQKDTTDKGTVPDGNMMLRDVLIMAEEPESVRLQLLLDIEGGGNYIQFNMEAFWAHRTQ